MIFFDFIGSFGEAIFRSPQYIYFKYASIAKKISVKKEIKTISSTTLKNAGKNMPLPMYGEFTFIII